MACVALALLGACAIAKYPPPAPPRQASLGLSITTTTLANGQRAVIVQDPHAVEVQVTMRYRVGAVDDGARPGMAHFVEHLMFQQVLEGQPLFTHFEDTSTFFNAYTSYDATTFVSRAGAEHLDRLLALEAARLEMRCTSITDGVFAREREVVINEIQERDQATEVYGAIHSVLYPEGHPYRAAIGGSVQSLGAITRDQACAFADAYYAPSNAVLVISGNLGDRAQAALAKYAASTSSRTGSAPRDVAAVTIKPIHVDALAPIDKDVLVLAWPLPTDPELQTKVRAVAASLPRLVDAEVKGVVVPLELGDRRAPMWGLAVLPADDETFTDVTMGTRRGIEKLPSVFDETDDVDGVFFHRVREGAIFGVYSGLEDGSDRDTRLAAYVLAGRDPNQALAAELRALRAMTSGEGVALAAQFFNANTPTVITLKANPGKKRGQALALRKPVHDMGQRRTPPDPALARQPAERAAARDVVAARTRVLPNGLRVVLLPMSSVPTVDIRMIFRAGTADEPVTQRGIAMLTANALTWDLHHLKDLLKFAAAGGMKNTDVGVDRTSFTVQGIDTHLDVLLAGLRRWVRDGTFDDDSAKRLIAMRRAAKRADDEGVLTDTWRAALFGAQHPYVRAGIVRYSNTALTLDDAAAFRAYYYTPSNATLVIAGHFDPVLADKWVEFLFADWAGAAAQRPAARITAQPASIAKVDDVALVQLRIAMPATAASRAEQLVAAEMLTEIARDVRFQLGASYAVDAQLSEQRLARYYVIGGYLDAARSAAAIQLIRERIQRLRSNADVAARAFVTARKHVITQLMSRVGSAESLAARVERDVELEREPMSDVQTAAAVQALTIDRMSATLAELDVTAATVLMRGPAAELKSAFAALGRTPTYVDATTATDLPAGMGPLGTAPIGTTAPPVRLSEVQPALTEQPPPRLAVMAIASAAVATHSENGIDEIATGTGFSVHVGYRYQRTLTVGLRGSYTAISADEVASEPVVVRPLSLGAFWQYASPKRWWVEGSVGLRVEHIADMTPHWLTGVGYSFEVGADLVTVGVHRIGFALGYEAMSFRTSEAGTFGIHAGLVYRR